MKARLWSRFGTRTREDGQALVLFSAAFLIFLFFVGIAVDVGRLQWAKAELQATVDSAALAGAQSMPEGQSLAEQFATQYWEDNKEGILGADPDATFQVTFPSGNRAVRVQADADIPTWFLRLFGHDTWEVTASGKAESQVLDIAIVLDMSGSMCFTSYPTTEGVESVVMGPGRRPAAKNSPVGGFRAPELATAVTTTSGTSITLTLNDVGIFNSTNSSTNRGNFGDTWNSSTRYWQYDPSGSIRRGMIMIDNEIFQITNLNTGTNTLTVTRGMTNLSTGVASPKQTHPAGRQVWFLNSGTGGDATSYCDKASPFQATKNTNGPHEPFDSAISNAQYFVSLFNEEYDRMSVVKYSTRASLVNGLNYSHSTIQGAMDDILFPSGSTNIAHGIAVAKASLDSARPNAKKIIVVLTDGVPNITCSDYSGSCSTTSSYTSPTSCTTSFAPLTHAKNQAAIASTAGIQVYTIGLGAGVLDCTLQQIAASGGGEYIKAPTTAQLDDAFREIALKTHIGLTD